MAAGAGVREAEGEGAEGGERKYAGKEGEVTGSLDLPGGPSCPRVAGVTVRRALVFGGVQQAAGDKSVAATSADTGVAAALGRRPSKARLQR